MTAVKICGLTRARDVALACELGASMVGFNFAAESPRRVTVESARLLSQEAAPGVLRVGVFVGEESVTIREAVEGARLDLVQLHRPLRGIDVESLPVPIIAVVHVAEEAPRLPDAEILARCRALLFDTLDPHRAGGTGRRFDWRLLAARNSGPPVLLAGGLGPDNVAEAVRCARPWGVDAASGVECAPGEKDPEKLRRFFRSVQEADADAA